MKGALLVPALSYNLLAIVPMTEEGYELEAHDGHLAITTPVGKEIFLDEKKTAW